MWNLRNAKAFIRDVITPLTGIVVMVMLVNTPGERPSYFLGAAAMMGLPIALAATRSDKSGNGKPKEPSNDD